MFVQELHNGGTDMWLQKCMCQSVDSTEIAEKEEKKRISINNNVMTHRGQ